MKLEKDSPQMKWFAICYHGIREFFGETYGFLPERTDICTFIRTCTVYPFMIGLAWFITAVSVLMSVFYFPISVMGVASFMATAIQLGVATAVIAGILYFAKHHGDSIYDSLEKNATVANEAVGNVVAATGFFPAIGSWIKIIWAWIVDKHNKVCRIVELES